MEETIKFKYKMHFQKVGRMYVGVVVDEKADSDYEALFLNETSYEICEILKTGATPSQILQHFKNEYDAEENVLMDCISEAIRSFDNMGILQHIT